MTSIIGHVDVARPGPAPVLGLILHVTGKEAALAGLGKTSAEAASQQPASDMGRGTAETKSESLPPSLSQYGHDPA
jgi:hypothetical protein